MTKDKAVELKDSGQRVLCDTEGGTRTGIITQVTNHGAYVVYEGIRGEGMIPFKNLREVPNV